ncbi:aspartate kinase [Aureibaculum marinum]|uniref:Aspartokinase n=1 Tax=Aureibaculum marinum TaxID=2487930 RepID=A0A3N4NWR7_9FLAO|nr:aspartate kinase [Aureibaculum marinum]RPD96029.1 aspartate kinase [Aureibaculum marinum]
MIVFKFGGTSVGSAENMKKVAAIINDCNEKKIVVLSAVSGTTNSLVQINDYLALHKKEDALFLIDKLENSYYQLIKELYNLTNYHTKAKLFIENKFKEIRSLANEPIKNDKIILAQGEIISTNLFQLYLTEIEKDSLLISALDFMSIDAHEEPEQGNIKAKLNKVLNDNNYQTYITQGFICLNANNEIDNLKRGGSDYTASLIGAAVNAEEIQIWTDIDGMHNNDPRFVDNTFPIDEISFDEAAELAYFGAKILHPQSIIPAQKNNIPVLLKNTFNPTAKGTLIKNCNNSIGVRAIAAKDGIIAIKIKSYRMLMAYGFLKNVFEVFEKYQTPIDMITTSEIAVSLTIDNPKYLKEIIEDLNTFGNVEYDVDMSIVCLAGNFSHSGKGISAAVLNCLTDVPIRMISYGGSQYNISLLIEKNDKIKALNLLNQGLFAESIPHAV